MVSEAGTDPAEWIWTWLLTGDRNNPVHGWKHLTMARLPKTLRQQKMCHKAEWTYVPVIGVDGTPNLATAKTLPREIASNILTHRRAEGPALRKIRIDLQDEEITGCTINERSLLTKFIGVSGGHTRDGHRGTGELTLILDTTVGHTFITLFNVRLVPGGENRISYGRARMAGLVYDKHLGLRLNRQGCGVIGARAVGQAYPTRYIDLVCGHPGRRVKDHHDLSLYTPNFSEKYL